MSFSGIYTTATIQNPSLTLSLTPVFLDVIADATWWAANTSTDKTKLRATVDIGAGEVELPTHTLVFDSGTTNLKMMVGVPSAPSTGSIVIKVYQALTASTSYLRTDTYGQNNVYSNTAISRFFPSGGGTEATGKGVDLTGEGGVSEGDVSTPPTGLGTTYNGSDQRFYGSAPFTARPCTFLTLCNPSVNAVGGMLNLADSASTDQQLTLTMNSPGTILAGLFAGSFPNVSTPTATTLNTWNFASARFTSSDFYTRNDDSTDDTTSALDPVGIDTIGLGSTQDTTKLWFEGALSWSWFFNDDIGIDWEDYLKSMTDDNATFTGAWTTEDPGGDAITGSVLTMSPIVLSSPEVSMSAVTIIADILSFSTMQLSEPTATASGNLTIIPNDLALTPVILSAPIITTDGEIIGDPLVLSTISLSLPTVSSPNDKIILFTGAVSFPIEGLDEITPTTGSVVQFSYGAYIRLEHNFTALSGDSVSMSYSDSRGNTQILGAEFTDSEMDTADGLLVDNLTMERGIAKLNLIITGTRNSIPFSVHSSPIEVIIEDGLYNQ